MKSALSLLLLSFSLQRIKCQSMESIESTAVKKPGETLTLSCRGSGFSFGCCSMHWIRQQVGKPLVWMGRVYSHGNSHDFSDSFSRRIEITRDNSKSMVYLKLSGLTAEDSAIYYCARDDYNYTVFDYWGKGTSVTVTSAESSAPKSIFAMSQCTSDSDGFLTIGCMARGFSPVDSLTFNWKDPARKELSDVVQYPAFGQDGIYTKISYLRVKKSELDPQNPYTCKASNSNGSLELDVSKVPVVPDGKNPSVFIYKPDKIDTDPVSHVCEVTSPKHGNVKIMWQVDDEPYIEGTTSAPIVNGDSTSVLSILTITKQKYEDLKTSIKCAVKHADDMADKKSPLQASTSKSKQREYSCD